MQTGAIHLLSARDEPLIFVVREAVRGDGGHNLMAGLEKKCSPGREHNRSPREAVELLLLEMFQDLAGPWLASPAVGDSPLQVEC